MLTPELNAIKFTEFIQSQIRKLDYIAVGILLEILYSSNLPFTLAVSSGKNKLCKSKFLKKTSWIQGKNRDCS